MSNLPIHSKICDEFDFSHQDLNAIREVYKIDVDVNAVVGLESMIIDAIALKSL